MTIKTQEGMIKIVRYEGAYSPQNYVEMVTGQCYLFQTDKFSDVIAEIQHLLGINGYRFRDYPLSEIAGIIEKELDVVLVKLAGEDSSGEWRTVYHWFEVTKTRKGGTD